MSVVLGLAACGPTGSDDQQVNAPIGVIVQTDFTAVADFDGDGNLDVANSAGTTIHIDFGDPFGGVDSFVDLVSSEASTVIARDFDGDGLADLAVLNGSNRVTLWRSEGGGRSFVVASNSIVGFEAVDMIDGDFDLDSRPDLAVITNNRNALHVLLNNGDGSFRNTEYPLSQAVTAVGRGDFDGDGFPDLAITGEREQILTLIARGDGTFRMPQVAYQSASALFTGITVADVDGDGRQDLVALESTGARIIIGNGDGTFSPVFESVPAPAAYRAVVVDLNNDSKLDLVISRDQLTMTSLVALGNGDGSFNSPTAYDTQGSASLVVVDLDADGNLDLVGAGKSYFRGRRVFRGHGDGTFDARKLIFAGQSPGPAAVADVDGDGIGDLVYLSGSVSVLQAIPGVGFSPPTASAIGGTRSDTFALGDLNGDGVPDVVVANAADDQVRVLLGTGGGSFGAASAIDVHDSPYAVAIGDLNGDGLNDVVVLNNTSKDVSVLLGNGDGTFAGRVDYAAASPAMIGAGEGMEIRIAEINGDGIPDVVTNLQGNTMIGAEIVRESEIAVLLGKGDGTLAPATITPLSTLLANSIIASDYNGDGLGDVAVLDASGSVNLLVGKGTGGFRPMVKFDVCPRATATRLITGDLDVDGRPDLFTACGDAGNTMVVLLANGSGGFNIVKTTGVGMYGFSPSSTSDFDGDGNLDVVLHGSEDGTFLILSGKGDGRF